MAGEKKPLFMSDEGFSQEMATTDTVIFGKVTVGTGGIEMGGNRITGLPTTPTATGDAVSQAYVDAVAQGLKPKEICKVVKATGNLALAGLPDIDGIELANLDRVLLNGQTSKIENGIWVAKGTRASLNLDPLTTNCDSVIESILGGVAGNSYTMAFTAGDSLDAGHIERSSNAFTFFFKTAVTTVQNFVDAVAGLTGGAKLIRVKSAGTVANVLAVTVDEFTATALAGGLDTAWTRPTDFAATMHAAGAFCFVDRGTLYADTGWVCTTNSPTDVIGTNNLDFTQFSAAGITTASTGLEKVGNDIRLKAGNGIVTTDGYTNVALSGTNPCLALAGSDYTKTLEVAVAAPGSGTGGIEKTSTGIQIDLDGTTLALGAGGLSALGVPADFTIAGTATHFDDPGSGAGKGQVTAPNLDTLTAGSSSNADSLHTHASSPATEAPKVENTVALAAGATCALGDPLYKDATTDDKFAKADASADASSNVLGIARQAQGTPGGNTEMVSIGLCAAVLAGAGARGTKYYLNAGGGLTTSLAGMSGKRIILVGVALNTNDLFVMIHDYGKKA